MAKRVETRWDAAWLGDALGPAQDDLTRAIDRVFAAGPSQAAQSEALKRLRRPADPALGLAYAALPRSPLGPVYVALSRRGLVALDFGIPRRTFLERLQRATGRPVRPEPDRARLVLDQVSEYLQGKRTRFSLPIDLSMRTDFQRRVLEATLEVPHGRLATYHEIARRIGRPKAARAVGRALATNPIPLIIPCHRVIASDGSLAGYGGKGGIATKARLLRMEGALAV